MFILFMLLLIVILAAGNTGNKRLLPSESLVLIEEPVTFERVQ